MRYYILLYSNLFCDSVIHSHENESVLNKIYVLEKVHTAIATYDHDTSETFAGLAVLFYIHLTCIRVLMVIYSLDLNFHVGHHCPNVCVTFFLSTVVIHCSLLGKSLHQSGINCGEICFSENAQH